MVDPIHIPIRPAGDLAAAGGAARIPGQTARPESPTFRDLLIDQIKQVDRMQHDADRAIESLATGRTTNIVEVMSAVEKADLAFKTLMQIRNRIVDAYQEIMRIRV